MARITLKVEMAGIYEYEAPAYGYGYETRYIYNMKGEDGAVYVWKTTAFMGIEIADPNGWIIRETGKKAGTYRFEKMNKGDRITIAATVKKQSEYNGTPQTELTRVTVLSREFKAETPEERQARLEAERKAKAQAQLDTISGGDFVWEMPYKQFKEHYSDCETVVGSFRRTRHGHSFIKVIVREGRLKASGVRGEHFDGYAFQFTENGETFCVVYRAVCEENALRRLQKDFPGATDIQLKVI